MTGGAEVLCTCSHRTCLQQVVVQGLFSGQLVCPYPGWKPLIILFFQDKSRLRLWRVPIDCVVHVKQVNGKKVRGNSRFDQGVAGPQPSIHGKAPQVLIATKLLDPKVGGLKSDLDSHEKLAV